MSGGSSIYSPLPQSNSDSDEFSEEELHSSNERQQVINRLSKLQKQAIPEVISNAKKQKVTSYKQLDNERDIAIALNGIQLGTDEITILKPNNKIETFSTSRKVCFIFSILLCISTTVVFLWVLPCEIGSCPLAPNLAETNSWKKLLSGIELYGPISVVPNVRDRSHYLVFLYRNSFKEGNEAPITTQGGGVISLFGGSGELSWKADLENQPRDIDCNIIDVDLDGLSDCLIVSGNNLLKAVHSLSGRILWDSHGTGEFDSKSCDLNFPVALPDLNGDRVSDLLTICSIKSRGREKLVSDRKNYFMLISGLTGSVMGSPMEISRCYSIRNFILEKGNLISYTCLDIANKESVRTVPLLEIISNEVSRLSRRIRLNQTNLKAQHQTSEEENMFYVQGRRLNLENQGQCPDDCYMILTIKGERNGRKNQTLWTMKRNDTYGMIPVIMKFEKFSGFVVKYWEWEPKKKQGIPQKNEFGNSSFLTGNIERKERVKRLKNSKSLERELLEGNHKESAREKRMLVKRQSQGLKQMESYTYKEENHIFHKILERVVLIIFNETDSHSVNASQSEITQICRKNGDCQPNLLLQRHSLLITDLDEDNFKELVSYSSSYVNRMQPDSMSMNFRWQLQSTVQVIRLEAELPKLYDSKNQ